MKTLRVIGFVLNFCLFSFLMLSMVGDLLTPGSILSQPMNNQNSFIFVLLFFLLISVFPPMVIFMKKMLTAKPSIVKREIRGILDAAMPMKQLEEGEQDVHFSLYVSFFIQLIIGLKCLHFLLIRIPYNNVDGYYIFVLTVALAIFLSGCLSFTYIVVAGRKKKENVWVES